MTVMGNICTISGCDRTVFGHGFCQMHYRRWYRYGDPLAAPKKDPPHVRFWRFVNKTDSCWNWTGHTTDGGYGQFATTPTERVMAHRYSYILIIGGIPDGLTLDHLCRNRACVNPLHLEPVTMRENTLRGNTLQARNAAKTHCDHGHEFTDANTYIRRNGSRACRECSKLKMRRYRSQRIAS
jgi:hypothetical protein